MRIAEEQPQIEELVSIIKNSFEYFENNSLELVSNVSTWPLKSFSRAAISKIYIRTIRTYQNYHYLKMCQTQRRLKNASSWI